MLRVPGKEHLFGSMCTFFLVQGLIVGVFPLGGEFGGRRFSVTQITCLWRQESFTFSHVK